MAPPNPAAFFATQPLTRRQRGRLAHGGTARLTVSTSRAGTITIRIRAPINGKLRTIQTVRRTLKAAGTIHPRIHLTRAARRQLATHHHLALTITATYSQSPSTQAIRTTLKTR